MELPERHVTGERPAWEARWPAVGKFFPTTSVRIRAAVLTPTAGMDGRRAKPKR
jgi:hypothetical protein